MIKDYYKVEKRSNLWGWFVHVDGCQPTFVAYGYITTKKEAIERRTSDMVNDAKRFEVREV